MIEINSKSRNSGPAVSAIRNHCAQEAIVRFAARILIAALLSFAVCLGANAHTGGMTGFATITISGKFVRYNLTLSDVPPGPLAEQMHLGQQGVTPDFRPLITAISEK